MPDRIYFVLLFVSQVTEVQNLTEVNLNVLTALKLNILIKTFYFLDIFNLGFLFYTLYDMQKSFF